MTGLPNTSGRNLALGQPASASTLEAGYLGPSYAVDGDLTTRWGSTFADPQWLSVDLGAVWSISSVKLVWERAYAVQYRVDVSPNGTTWKTVYATSSGTGGTVTSSVSKVPARYVRMYGTRRVGDYGYSLLEFEVH